MGTADGISKSPYIRESRRIRALTTILETDISTAFVSAARARTWSDSVGIGLYPIDRHPCGAGEYPMASGQAKPFQIPFGALVPVEIDGLLAGAKNPGTTHITNSAYRLHPIEWNVGEAAGVAAALAVESGVEPRDIARGAGPVRFRPYGSAP